MNNKGLVDDLRAKGHKGYGADKRARRIKVTSEAVSDEYDRREQRKMEAKYFDKPGTDAMARVKAAKVPVAWGVLQYFPRALSEVAKVSKFGCEKYNQSFASRGFLQPGYPIEGYDDAMVRHLLALFVEGPVNRTDGNLLHRAQIIWCAMAALEKELWLADQDANKDSTLSPAIPGAEGRS